MSRKSRQPDGGKSRKKGKKGKKGEATVVVEEVVEEGGLPFGLVVLIAVLMTLPVLTQFFEGGMTFQSTVVRFLGALLVSWLLCQLVVSVVGSFATTQTETVTTTQSQPPPADTYRYPDGTYPPPDATTPYEDPYGQPPTP